MRWPTAIRVENPVAERRINGMSSRRVGYKYEFACESARNQVTLSGHMAKLFGTATRATTRTGEGDLVVNKMYNEEP